MPNEPDTESSNSPPTKPVRKETRAELYAKLLVGLGAFAVFCIFAGYDILHPNTSVPMSYLAVLLAITGAVFGIDIFQRVGNGDR